ncbi:helix-turn-helix transcriptional regulator [Trichocoleus sp. FACHB-591]|uniref:helix-turn-helix domain-containing protein n=1 Tax=Trichocoleus TaxID=450526 RepID=UPI001686936D|nr:helix-turn-helix transcriptional regulator [Trichocoleus sp. FACHB-591]MBD2095851.1 helix-turn-helix transcriptional regulator [Trichocoleus sp. FACHB-591]
MLTAEQPQIGHIIRELRQQLKLSQEKFAAKLGVSFQTVNRWENNRTQPSPMALQLIEGMLKEQGDRSTDSRKHG